MDYFFGRSEIVTADSVAGVTNDSDEQDTVIYGSSLVSQLPYTPHPLSVRYNVAKVRKKQKKAANREKPIELPFMSLITQRIILRKLR